MKTINFDMDGTLADFYNVEGWLNDLHNENTRPYKIAKPLFNFSVLARYLHSLQNNGYIINIISWTCKNGSENFNKAVEQSKKEWLKKHLPSVKFNNIFIIPYGTPKSYYGNGILFDDEYSNREEWNGTAYNAENILEILKNLLTK